MTIVKKQMTLHHAVSVIGGFVGAYTIVNHCEIFANAQTGNLFRFVIGAFRGDFESAAYCVLAFLVYAAGNAFYVIARKYFRVSMKIISFMVTAAAFAVTGAVCRTENDMIAVLPIVFMAPVQWNAFKSAGGNSSSTIFSSNNVRQAVMLLTSGIMNKDKTALKNARFYWATLLFFHVGAAAGVLLSLTFGVYSIWFGYIFLAAAAAAYYRYETAKINAFK